MRKTLSRVVGLVATASAVSLLLAAIAVPASAIAIDQSNTAALLTQAPAGTSDIALSRFSGDELAQATQPAANAQGLTRTRVDNFLEDAVRQGRLVDEANVRVLTVMNPYGGQIDVVWDDLAKPEYLGVTNQGDLTGGQGGIGAIFSESPDQAIPSTNAGGFGYEHGQAPQGMYQYGNTSCRTVYFTPKYAHNNDHWTTTCYEKWAQSGTNRWIYNRWALWTRGTPKSGVRAETVDYTTRSRPWKGQESKVIALDNWTPAHGANNCAATYSFSLSFSGVGVTIPIHECSSTSVLPEANVHSMGMDWGGYATYQLYEDYGMAIRASTTSVVPVMADYLWAEVRYCGETGIHCYNGTPSQYLLLADSGW